MFDSYSDSRRASRTLRSESIFRHPSIVFNDSLSIRLSTSLRLRLAWLLESGFLFLSVLRPKSSPESSWARSWSSIALNLPSIVEPLSWLASIPESVTESLCINLTEPSCIPYVLFTHGVFCEIVFFLQYFEHQLYISIVRSLDIVIWLKNVMCFRLKIILTISEMNLPASLFLDSVWRLGMRAPIMPLCSSTWFVIYRVMSNTTSVCLLKQTKIKFWLKPNRKKIIHKSLYMIPTQIIPKLLI